MTSTGSMSPARAAAWHRVSSHRKKPVADLWQVVALEPNSANAPARAWKLAKSMSREMMQATSDRGACTVATALEQYQLSIDELSQNVLLRDTVLPDARSRNDVTGDHSLDDSDWWFRSEFEHDANTNDTLLVFDGLASIVDVWLNDVWLGRTNNMFMRWEADVSGILSERNELVLCARAMTQQLAPRRPRARWRARLVGSQEWRWHRTTQLGRMPGFGPPTPPIGPWREINLEQRTHVAISSLSVLPDAVDGLARLNVVAELQMKNTIQSATLVVGDVSGEAAMRRNGQVCTISAAIVSNELQLWWPHTYGTPHTYASHLNITLTNGDAIRIDLGNIGFRAIAIETFADDFSISVNHHKIFARGVCWNPRNMSRVDVPAAQLDSEFSLLTSAGVNCIRLPGCFTYPSHEFLAACDKHGIMVWQDLMFSVLDYPESDAAFVALAEQEVRQVLTSMAVHACVAVVCGNAEVAQQAAMMGVPPSQLTHSLFRERLAAVVASTLPNIPYWPSTPWGGTLPFDTQHGTAHYFGVGAYKRDLHDARRSGVRFATECLAFAHVPEPESLATAPVSFATVHGGEWKTRIPRDSGADWDFEDIRDHYVERFFGGSSSGLLRETDPHRYLALGRAASAIAIERTLQEFRRSDSSCNGALLWLWNDPWMGAGWGSVDSSGHPKSAWYALKRASRAVAIALFDEGLNGANVQLWNDSPGEVSGILVLRLMSADGRELQTASRTLTVGARSSAVVSCDELIGRFTDIVHAYRFGAPSHDVVHAIWTSTAFPAQAKHGTQSSQFNGQHIIDEAALLPLGDARSVEDTGLHAERIVRIDEKTVCVSLTSERTSTFVRIGCAGWIADDSYFTLVPGVERVVTLTNTAAAHTTQPPVFFIEALNCSYVVRCKLPSLSNRIAAAPVSSPLVCP